MSATVPTASIESEAESIPEIPILAGPAEIVEEYLSLVEERRAIEDRISFLRAELEMIAAPVLTEEKPRGRFVSERGSLGVRISPSCVFDRAVVARELQKMGKLAEVAVLQGPGLARYLAKEPVVAARLGQYVRMRKSIVMMPIDRA